jgi:hypothetical protein
MSKVLLELSVSLDGFVAGPDIGPGAPLGIGGFGNCPLCINVPAAAAAAY